MSHDEFEDVSFEELKVLSRVGTIISKKIIEEDVYSIQLKLDQEMLFYPGQYILVDYQLEDEKYTRAYTMISSSLDKNIIELNIQKTEDPLTSHIITSMSVGDSIAFKGPYGRFVLTNKMKLQSLCLVAVNIGINPFISMLRYTEETKMDTAITLLYQWDHGQILFEKELKRLEGVIDLQWKMIEDINAIEDLTVFNKSDMIFICGEKFITNPFMKKINEIPREKIKLEQWF
jgi:ferredoxin-NADP reductase